MTLGKDSLPPFVEEFVAESFDPGLTDETAKSGEAGSTP